MDSGLARHEFNMMPPWFALVDHKKSTGPGIWSQCRARSRTQLASSLSRTPPLWTYTMMTRCPKHGGLLRIHSHASTSTSIEPILILMHIIQIHTVSCIVSCPSSVCINYRPTHIKSATIGQHGIKRIQWVAMKSIDTNTLIFNRFKFDQTQRRQLQLSVNQGRNWFWSCKTWVQHDASMVCPGGSQEIHRARNMEPVPCKEQDSTCQQSV